MTGVNLWIGRVPGRKSIALYRITGSGVHNIEVLAWFRSKRNAEIVAAQLGQPEVYGEWKPLGKPREAGGVSIQYLTPKEGSEGCHEVKDLYVYRGRNKKWSVIVLPSSATTAKKRGEIIKTAAMSESAGMSIMEVLWAISAAGIPFQILG